MREALGDLDAPNDGHTAGWAWSYPLKAALEEWLDGDYDKDRAGLLEAVQSLETIDYEGMLPEEAGNRAGDPNETIFRADRDQRGRPGSADRRDDHAGLLRRARPRRPTSSRVPASRADPWVACAWSAPWRSLRHTRRGAGSVAGDQPPDDGDPHEGGEGRLPVGADQHRQYGGAEVAAPRRPGRWWRRRPVVAGAGAGPWVVVSPGGEAGADSSSGGGSGAAGVVVSRCSRQATNWPSSLSETSWITPRPNCAGLPVMAEVGDAPRRRWRRPPASVMVAVTIGAGGAVAALVLALGLDHQPVRRLVLLDERAGAGVDQRDRAELHLDGAREGRRRPPRSRSRRGSTRRHASMSLKCAQVSSTPAGTVNWWSAPPAQAPAAVEHGPAGEHGREVPAVVGCRR